MCSERFIKDNNLSLIFVFLNKCVKKWFFIFVKGLEFCAIFIKAAKTGRKTCFWVIFAIVLKCRFSD